jgi:predicted glycoside hydrolase/deacetylase ChbG (UPF0249 family)
MTRILIVNADDFGRSPGVNAGVVAAHEHGIVTSASLMVRWPAAVEAAAYARRRPSFAVGLHLDLGEWQREDGDWKPVYEVVDVDDVSAVSDELRRQLSAFETLVRAPPTHLDSHQHVHRTEPVRSVLAEAGAKLGVPVRDLTPHASYSGHFYGDGSPDATAVESLVALLESLGPGVTELGCHPGSAPDFPTSYGEQRRREVETLCDPRVRATLQALRIELRSFADVNMDVS